MKNWILIIGLFFVVAVQGAFVEIKNVQELNDLVQKSSVPVVVQFSAYWCNPCKKLKAVFNQIASNFSDEKVRLAWVDAYVNPSLQSYLLGGYPTVRSFYKGALTNQSFVDTQTPEFVTNFVNKVIQAKNSTSDLEAVSCPIE